MKAGRIYKQSAARWKAEQVVAVVDRFVCLALSPNGENENRSPLAATTLHVNTKPDKSANSGGDFVLLINCNQFLFLMYIVGLSLIAKQDFLLLFTFQRYQIKNTKKVCNTTTALLVALLAIVYSVISCR